MDELSGQTAVITGGASGIGLELARQFGAAGMNLVIGDVESDPLRAATNELVGLGYQVASLEIDVRHLDELRALEALATDRYGNVHVLCNNAGVGTGGLVAEADDLELWRWTIDINLWGTIYGCKVFLPGMLAHGEPAHVVNTASMAGLVAVPMMGAYCVSKYGVVALSETLSQEMQMEQTNVGVSVLCPAFVKTAIASSHRNLPDEIAGSSPESNETFEFISAAVDAGMAPAVVGAAVVDAVRSNRFWVLTHPESESAITGRAQQIVDAINPAPRSIPS